MNLARPLAAMLVVAAAVVGGSTDFVAADAPTRQGWWSHWQNPGAEQGLPVLIPVPAPPVGDEDGLTIALDPRGVEAVAALHFGSSPGADAELVLKDANDQVLTIPPEASVEVCTAASDWAPEMNGPWVNAPTWSEDCLTGVLSAERTTLEWTLPAGMQDDDGAFDLVIVPVGPAPFLVNFAATDDSTFSPGPTPPTTTTEATTTTTEPVRTVTTVETFPGTPGSPGVVMVPTTAPPRVTTRTSLVVSRPIGVPRTPLRFPDGRGQRMMAVSLLMGMAAGLWWMGGSPTRGPRLLGALAGRGAVAGRADRPGGLGRFARPRGGPAPRL